MNNKCEALVHIKPKNRQLLRDRRHLRSESHMSPSFAANPLFIVSQITLKWLISNICGLESGTG